MLSASVVVGTVALILSFVADITGILGYFDINPQTGLDSYNNLSTTDSPISTKTIVQTPLPTIETHWFLPTLPMPKSTAPQVPLATSPSSSTMIPRKDGMVMVYVPGGNFIMGGETNRGGEWPAHTVYLQGFWIDQTEVTNAMYILCEQQGVCFKHAFSDYPNRPVVYVTWYDAKVYCEWAGKRLPTDAEWEKAARSIDGRTYPWGETLTCQYANFRGCIQTTEKIKYYLTTDVGSYPLGESPYGALDMSGNVWEWVSSLYKPYPYSPDDGRESTTSSDRRVARGGSWLHDDPPTTMVRMALEPTYTNDWLGFRCVNSE